jgi:hypothetical protein
MDFVESVLDGTLLQSGIDKAGRLWVGRFDLWKGMLVDPAKQAPAMICHRPSPSRRPRFLGQSAFTRVDRLKAAVVVFDDLRFPNEYAAIQYRGGYCVKVSRLGWKSSVPQHISKTILDDHARLRHPSRREEWRASPALLDGCGVLRRDCQCVECPCSWHDCLKVTCARPSCAHPSTWRRTLIPCLWRM